MTFRTALFADTFLFFAATFLFFAAFLFGAISASVLGFVTRGRVSEVDGSDAHHFLSTNRPEIDAELNAHCWGSSFASTMSTPLRFPPDFLFGVATAAYQVEGHIENDWSEWERARRTPHVAGAGVDHWNRWAGPHPSAAR